MIILLSEVLGGKCLIPPFMGLLMFPTGFFFLLLFYDFVRTHPKPGFISCHIPSGQFCVCFSRLPFMLIFHLGVLRLCRKRKFRLQTQRRANLSHVG